MAQRMRVRRRTAAGWASGNEVLLDSEIGRETDTNRLKIGDGVTAWNSLAYYPGDPSTRVLLTPETRKVVTGSAFTYGFPNFVLRDNADAVQLSGSYAELISIMDSTDGNVWSDVFAIQSGTYDVYLIADCWGSTGKVQFAIDGTNIGSLIDTYRASECYIKKQVATSLAIASGRHKLTCTTNGKNASSGGYFQYHGNVIILPHGAD